MVLLMFFEAVYFGHFLSFYTMQLEPPKQLGSVQVCAFRKILGRHLTDLGVVALRLR